MFFFWLRILLSEHEHDIEQKTRLGGNFERRAEIAARLGRGAAVDAARAAAEEARGAERVAPIDRRVKVPRISRSGLAETSEPWNPNLNVFLRPLPASQASSDMCWKTTLDNKSMLRASDVKMDSKVQHDRENRLSTMARWKTGALLCSCLLHLSFYSTLPSFFIALEYRWNISEGVCTVSFCTRVWIFVAKICHSVSRMSLFWVEKSKSLTST